MHKRNKKVFRRRAERIIQIRFADWGHKWIELFESDECYFAARPMYHFPLNQSWETLPNLTMIGDAAHRMQPYAGEGVNMAMLDALELCEALCKSNFDDTISAIQHFEKGMCARSSDVTEFTLENTEMFHSENGLTDLLNFFNSNKPENN